MREIIPPTSCPACDSVLELVNEQLFCRNYACPEQWDKKLSHFASTLKIKGLGPATIEKLQVLDYPELYELSVDDLVDRIGSEKLASKLFDEIQKSKSVSLQELLPAFSISLIGQSASQKLCDSISSVDEISEKSCIEAGIGPKATANLLSWLETEFKPNKYRDSLPFNWKVKKVNKIEKVQGVVCITGKLKSYPTKAHAEQVLKNFGFITKPSLTKDCTHLINESGIESAKTQTARERGVIIITNIRHLIEENTNGIT